MAPEDWCRAAETLLETGAALVAYDAVSEGLRAFPGHLRLRQLLALALARSGASRQSNGILQQLRDEGHGDEETLGLLARTHKDLWKSTTDPAERRRHLEQAHGLYREAYRASRGYWSGVNAATTALLLDRRDDAIALARSVREECLRLRDTASDRGDGYWVLATLGEASLILGERAAAESWYAQAATLGRTRPGDQVSTRRNARLILGHLGADDHAVDACFRIPRVVAFAGHLVDRPGRPQPRFPASLEPAVRDAVREGLQRVEAGLGYASAACGADIIFLECLREAGGKTHVVLPYNRQQFLEDCVDIVPGADWPSRYEAVLAAAAQVIVASDQRLGNVGASYEYGFQLLDGVAALRADELESDPVCFAVWDGQPGDGAGGTAASVDHWRRRGQRVEVVDLARLLHEHSGLIVSTPAAGEAPVTRQATAAVAPRGFDAQVVGLLFADTPGFSKLSEAELPLFVQHYLGLVAVQLSLLSSPPLLTNTWGDGLHAAFRHVRDAGTFALGLCDAIRTTDWAALGFGSALSIRIGLHAGPAYACTDPVTGRPSYIGAHVSRAARIEPIAPPGEVYASAAFAALARAEDVRDFTCSYVGPTPLAKGYGTFPTYVLKRREP